MTDDAENVLILPKAPDEFMTYQRNIHTWMLSCFGPLIAADGTERCHRFVEEALELSQACGGTRSDAHKLVDYVFDRQTGERSQEVGGVMVTLAALCNAFDLDMGASAAAELVRVWGKIDVIRAKQAAKPIRSPLPIPTGAAP